MKVTWDFHELYDFADRLAQTDKLQETLKEATRELAKVLQSMLLTYTPVATGRLRSAWMGGSNASFVARRTPEGFEVTLTNDATNEHGYEYGADVNDGHYSYNQFNVGGDPYVVQHRLPKVYTIEGANKDATYVFGHFFVEKSVVATADLAEEVIYEELTKWFRWCCGG